MLDLHLREFRPLIIAKIRKRRSFDIRVLLHHVGTRSYSYFEKGNNSILYLSNFISKNELFPFSFGSCKGGTGDFFIAGHVHFRICG
jgi:hypothetical protein